MRSPCFEGENIQMGSGRPELSLPEPNSAFHKEKQTCHVSMDHGGVQGYEVLNLGLSLNAYCQAGGAIS